VILVDSNIPMCLVGAPHPHKSDAQRLLEELVSDRQRLVTDAEVLEEILHRYVAIDCRDAIQPAFDAGVRPYNILRPMTRDRFASGREVAGASPGGARRQ
jgi:predicted nucleic acid-binding protein